jgi:hypothetical protein
VLSSGEGQDDQSGLQSLLKIRAMTDALLKYIYRDRDRDRDPAVTTEFVSGTRREKLSIARPITENKSQRIERIERTLRPWEATS